MPLECCPFPNEVFDQDEEYIYRRSCDCVCHCPKGDDDHDDPEYAWTRTHD